MSDYKTYADFKNSAKESLGQQWEEIELPPLLRKIQKRGKAPSPKMVTEPSPACLYSVFNYNDNIAK
ncbi:MAG: hypothetical protein VB081_10480 [Christensenella sp.]|uniref:hypothetical protein n=1 Tax=Christensenella sp. TaxID=1935934 RepID=UPI002B1FA7C0|nr:hypothetical protein [Christensenella sp.]MEA5003912.1 hypothetical protein [Christensenella sp.]